MSAIAGIKYTKNPNSSSRYVRIDLDVYGDNQLLEDFLDLAEIKSRKDNETVSLDEFNRYIDKRIEANV